MLRAEKIEFAKLRKFTCTGAAGRHHSGLCICANGESNKTLSDWLKPPISTRRQAPPRPTTRGLRACWRSIPWKIFSAQSCGAIPSACRNAIHGELAEKTAEVKIEVEVPGFPASQRKRPALFRCRSISMVSYSSVPSSGTATMISDIQLSRF
jgi:hypothetical protein